MATWPQVVSYLVTLGPTLWPSAMTFDGPPNTGDDPTDYVTVGYHPGGEVAGDFTQEHVDDFSVTELGTVRVELITQTGDDVFTNIRTRLFAMFDALDAHLRADQTLGGVLSANGTVLLTSDQVLMPSTSTGLAMSLPLTLTYTTQLY